MKTPDTLQKKGSVAQKQIALIAQQKSQAKTPEEKRKEAEKLQREKDKKAAEQAAKETAELFKPIAVQKVPFGVDPKTVLCQAFKAGYCEKGKKCKFSHDLAVERKVAKRDLYTDARTEEEENSKKDDMANWDEGMPPCPSVKGATTKEMQKSYAKWFYQNMATPKQRQTLYANTLYRPWRMANTGGFGHVLLAEINANTGTRFHRALY